MEPVLKSWAMQVTLAILRIGNTEILEEKNRTEYNELQKHHEERRRAEKKIHLNRIIP